MTQEPVAIQPEELSTSPLPDQPDSGRSGKRFWLSWMVGFASATIVVAGCLMIMAFLRFGSVRPAFVFLRGNSLHVDVPPSYLGSIEVGGQVPVTFTVYNLTSRPYHVIGTNADCSCVRSESLPLRVPPWGKREIHFRIAALREGRAQHTMGIFTDCPTLSTAHAKISYECVQ